jgi:hypothetical protein
LTFQVAMRMKWLGIVTTHFLAVAYHVQEGCGNRLEIRRTRRRQGAGEDRPVLR